MQLDAAMQAFERNGFTWTFCATAAQAADYIVSQCKGKKIGFGGSMTLDGLGAVSYTHLNNNLHDSAGGFPIPSRCASNFRF